MFLYQSHILYSSNLIIKIKYANYVNLENFSLRTNAPYKVNDASKSVNTENNCDPENAGDASKRLINQLEQK